MDNNVLTFTIYLNFNVYEKFWQIQVSCEQIPDYVIFEIEDELANAIFECYGKTYNNVHNRDFGFEIEILKWIRFSEIEDLFNQWRISEHCQEIADMMMRIAGKIQETIPDNYFPDFFGVEDNDQ